MSFRTTVDFQGRGLTIQWPMSESIIDIYVRTFTCKRWPDRLSDCKINGKLVSPIIYAISKDNPPSAKNISRKKK